jgi:outer membrane protein
MSLILFAALLSAGRVVTLEEALRSARERQPQLRQARAAAEAASARAREAFAPMLPQLTATAGYQRTTANAISRPGSASVPQRICPTATDPTAPCSPWTTFNAWSDNVSATLLLWDWGGAPYKWKAAEAQADALVAQERVTALQVDFTVRSSYFDARANKALVQVAQDTLRNQLQHLRQTEGFVKAGTHPEIDLVQARTDTANAQVSLINAENTYETSKVTLNVAMGVLGPTDYDVSDDAMAAVPGEDAEVGPLLEEAQKSRPEVENLEKIVRADELTVRSIEGAYLPALSASAGFTQGGTNPWHMGWNGNVGLSLSWGLFQGGLTRAQVQEAEANVGGEIAALDLLRQQLRSDVEAARLALRAAKATISATQEALRNAKERLRLAEQRYAVGVGSAIELGDAQVALTQAAAQAVQADDKLSTARAQLLRALGRP